MRKQSRIFRKKNTILIKFHHTWLYINVSITNASGKPGLDKSPKKSVFFRANTSIVNFGIIEVYVNFVVRKSVSDVRHRRKFNKMFFLD